MCDHKVLHNVSKNVLIA